MSIRFHIFKSKNISGKEYRIANEKDQKYFSDAEKYLLRKSEMLSKKFNINAVLYEETPIGVGSGAERAFALVNYGLDSWDKLYNSRQKCRYIYLSCKSRFPLNSSEFLGNS